MLLDKQLLVEQYRQCNEHLRESDRKRDVILGSYVTLSVLVYTFAAQTPNSDYFRFVVVGLALLGIVVGFLFTLYRGWHGLYVIQAIILQEILHKDRIDIGGKFVRKIDFAFNYVTSIELLMFFVLHSVVFVNSFVGVYLTQNSQWELHAFAILIIAWLEFTSHFIVMAYLDKLKKNGKLGTRYLWLLQSTLKNWPEAKTDSRIPNLQAMISQLYSKLVSMLKRSNRK